ncbi:MAG: 50S ribosomal protein L17 [Bacteroidales bacterium]|nr:50S ribosomal protein L17 [Bacteroidales bacterium]MCF8403824.1 50S ribosomal protein L17 [Bacteroidales bacterium]
MRHRRKINHLSRKSAHRKAMLANMATSLILHKRIHTTLAKAKALRSYVEPIITKSKEDTTHSRRVVFGYLQSKQAVTELFRDISVKVADRPGGYTRIIKTGTRLGDNAEMCMMELVDFNENLLAGKDSAAKSSRRRRRGGAKKEETAKGAKAAAAVAGAGVSEKEAEVEEKTVVKDETVVEEVTSEAEAVTETKVEEPVVVEDTAEVITEDVVAEVEEKVKEVVEEPKAEAKADDTEAAKEEKADEEDSEKKE